MILKRHFDDIPKCLFYFYNKYMNEYVIRLERIGIAAHEAYRIVYDFLKNFGYDALDAYIESLEEEYYYVQY